MCVFQQHLVWEDKTPLTESLLFIALTLHSDTGREETGT